MKLYHGTNIDFIAYAKLTDSATGLYFQSPVYIYSYLDRELTTGKM